jgi:hypothetical protein
VIKISSANKIKFEQILEDTRHDLEGLKQLHLILVSKIGISLPDDETKRWIMDVFLDKVYGTEAKIKKIFKEISGGTPHNTISAISELATNAKNVAYTEEAIGIRIFMTELTKSINKLIEYAEWDLSSLRRRLNETNWKELDKIAPIDYSSIESKRYLTAREELGKAKEKINEYPEDVMGHLRTAIDLSIKERFGFKKIHKMLNFLEDAQRLNFPLPSYSVIYTYFNEGSKRLHEGKINTSFEAREAIRTVSNFIDELELIQISSEQIENFKKECKYIE